MADGFWGMENKFFSGCVCVSWETEHPPADGPTYRSMGTTNTGVDGLLLEKKKRAPSLLRVKSPGRIKRRG